MYKSKELRWFSTRKNEKIMDWFGSHRLNLDSTEARTDFYLPLQKEDIGIKLREGHIEIKHRTVPPEAVRLKSSVKGYLEEWIKWSFEKKADDPMFEAITKKKEYDWHEVAKKRMAVKLIQKDGNLITVPAIEEVPYGCQIEYTLTRQMGKEWFTFGIEWFGHEFVELGPSLLSKILGNTQLRLRQSMGYAAFLSRKRRFTTT